MKVYPVADLVLPIDATTLGLAVAAAGGGGSVAASKAVAAVVAIWWRWWRLRWRWWRWIGGGGGGQFSVPDEVAPSQSSANDRSDNDRRMHQLFELQIEARRPTNKPAQGCRDCHRCISKAGRLLERILQQQAGRSGRGARNRPPIDGQKAIGSGHRPDQRGLAKRPAAIVDVRVARHRHGARRPIEDGDRAGRHVGRRFQHLGRRAHVHCAVSVAPGTRSAGDAVVPASREDRAAAERSVRVGLAGGRTLRRYRRHPLGDRRHPQPGLANEHGTKSKHRPRDIAKATLERLASEGHECRAGSVSEAIAGGRRPRLRRPRFVDRRRGYRRFGRRAKRHDLLGERTAHHRWRREPGRCVLG